MDKFQGEQLNRAYELYRLAVMEKERHKKEMQQQADRYERQSREQRKQIASLKSRISVLTSQLSSLAGAGSHGSPQSPKLENKDGWMSEAAPNLTLEQIQEQLRVSLQLERHYKEQLDKEKLRYLDLEVERDKLKSDLCSKREETQHLKHLLKEANERRDKKDSRATHGHDVEMRSKNVIPEPSAAASALGESASVQRLFSDIEEEFNRICRLTRKQRSQLNTILTKKGIASDPPFQFSNPVQCTDEENQEAKSPTKPKARMTRSRFAPMATGSLSPDDDVSVSIESLSNLSVKFPPSSDESEFLENSAEKMPIIPPPLEQSTNSGKMNMETSRHRRKFSTTLNSPPYSPRSPRTVCHMDNAKLEELGFNYRDTFVAGVEDSSLFFGANSPVRKNTIAFDIPDVEDSLELTGRTVRGPQQPTWKPSSHQDSDPPVAASEKWDLDSSDVCEFCQAVFPPSTKAAGDFLRHLNSHFKGQP